MKVLRGPVTTLNIKKLKIFLGHREYPIHEKFWKFLLGPVSTLIMKKFEIFLWARVNPAKLYLYIQSSYIFQLISTFFLYQSLSTVLNHLRQYHSYDYFGYCIEGTLASGLSD